MTAKKISSGTVHKLPDGFAKGHSSQTRRCEHCGKTSRRLRAMSGFAGLHLAKKRRREISVSRRRSQNLKAECVGHVVGPVVLIAPSNFLHSGLVGIGMIEKIALKVFWIFMLLCASSALTLLWVENIFPEKIIATFFIPGLASFLIWAPLITYRFLAK